MRRRQVALCAGVVVLLLLFFFVPVISIPIPIPDGCEYHISTNFHASLSYYLFTIGVFVQNPGGYSRWEVGVPFCA